MRCKTIIGILLVMFTLSTGAVFAKQETDSSKTSYMMVLSAKSGSLKGDTLILNDVPNVLYFSDRPDRKVGHTSLTKFVNIWDRGEDNFEIDPPNAALSVLTEDGAQNAVIKLVSAEHNDNSIIFKVDVLHGEFNGSFETATLYIDPDTQTPPITP